MRVGGISLVEVFLGGLRSFGVSLFFLTLLGGVWLGLG